MSKVNYVWRDEITGEVKSRVLTPEEIEMIGGFYKLPEDEDNE